MLPAPLSGKLAASGLVLGAAFFVWGCKKNPAAPADAGALATIADAQAADASADGGAVANDAGTALVLYDDDEVAVDHAPLTVKAQSASVRAAMPDGAVLATLLRGANATQLAERHGFYRIEATDPKDPSKKVSGWTVKYAFEEERAKIAPTSTPKPGVARRCALPAIAVAQAVDDPTPRCAYVCKNDRECSSAGMTCEVAIALPAANEAPSPTPSYTTVCSASPNAPKNVDAGAPKVPSLFGVPHAGDGKCPRGFATAPKFGTLCYRTCKADTECPSEAKCKPTPNGKLCFAN